MLYRNTEHLLHTFTFHRTAVTYLHTPQNSCHIPSHSAVCMQRLKEKKKQKKSVVWKSHPWTNISSFTMVLTVRFRQIFFSVSAWPNFPVTQTLTEIAPWTGRFYSLLDPSYAKNNIPIIASVSEHQPTTWSSFYFDLQLLMFLFPVGLYYCFIKLTDANIFIIMYGVTSIYFAVSLPLFCVWDSKHRITL